MFTGIDRKVFPVMIERRWSPLGSGMADCTIFREIRCPVIGIVRSVEIIPMAVDTGKGKPRPLVVDVAFRTCNRCMRTGQWEMRCIVIERCRRPSVGTVALFAVRWKVALLMVRFRRGRVFRLMAGVAVGGRTGVDIVRMTLLAQHSDVFPPQWKACSIVIELCRFPGVG